MCTCFLSLFSSLLSLTNHVALRISAGIAENCSKARALLAVAYITWLLVFFAFAGVLTLAIVENVKGNKHVRPFSPPALDLTIADSRCASDGGSGVEDVGLPVPVRVHQVDVARCEPRDGHLPDDCRQRTNVDRSFAERLEVRLRSTSSTPLVRALVEQLFSESHACAFLLFRLSTSRHFTVAIVSSLIVASAGSGI